MKRIIAGYTAAPADKQLAARYYGELVQAKDADGLGFAWTGPQTADTLAETLALLPRDWVITLTDISATWKATAANPLFGLASPDEAGRAAAMAMLGETAATIRAINDRAGRKLVAALEIHSAPGFDNRVLMPAFAPFARSLGEAARMAWDGCSVLVEHCDAFVDGQKPAKGFLRLDEEIRALAGIEGTPLGLSLNWGRSMIELRDPDRVVDHAEAGARSGLLRAYTFSGTADTANVFGDAFMDSHLAFAPTGDGHYGEPASQMTVERAARVVRYLDGCEFVAVKTNWPPKAADPLERAASVLANFRTTLSVLGRR